MSVPNQRIIYIERVSDQARKEFFKVGHQQLRKAASDLGGNAFKLYIYLCDNKDGFKLELSSRDFIAWSGTSQSTYDRAFKELKEKKYLIQAEGKKKLFLFVEESRDYDERHQEDKIILSDKQIIDQLFYGLRQRNQKESIIDSK